MYKIRSDSVGSLVQKKKQTFLKKWKGYFNLKYFSFFISRGFA